ncbi:DUF1257 domain-containing protein [Nostoc sp. DSM 114161]|jgi:hypothetical protein
MARNTLNNWREATELLKKAGYQEKGGHFSTLRSKITDANILKKTLRDLGISVKTEADVRGYNGQRVCCDVVAVLEGNYDIGWARNSDGSFDMIADLAGITNKHNQTELINSINQRYAVNQTLANIKNRETIKPKCSRCGFVQVVQSGYHNYKKTYKCQSCGNEFFKA